MVPIYLNKNGYQSCIKIAGISILPPLVTEEMKKELVEYKMKAIEIETVINRKRCSIDSGVMIGSYIDNIKNIESQQTNNTAFYPLSVFDLTSNGSSQNDANNDVISHLESDCIENSLQAALEDTRFRELFYNSAEKIFKNNRIENVNKTSLYTNTPTFKTDHVISLLSKESNEINKSNETNILSNFGSIDDLLDVTLTPLNCSQSGKKYDDIPNNSNPDSCAQLSNIVVEKSSPTHHLVRRNSYTLESPSPVLLEHLAKEREGLGEKNDKWKSLSEKKETDKSLGFKTFSSAKKPRKTWNKKSTDHSVASKASNNDSYDIPQDVYLNVSKEPESLLKRAETFVKSPKEPKAPILSLPCSSRTSPIHFFHLTRSADCITAMTENPLNRNEGSPECSSIMPEPIRGLELRNQECSEIVIRKENIHTEDNCDDMQTCLPNLSNPTSYIFPNIDEKAMHLETKDSISQYSTSQSFVFKQNIFSNKSYFKDLRNSIDQQSQIDEAVSVCSSLSLSKFLPLDGSISRPSTAEDLSQMLSKLEFEHKRQIDELLQKQHNEKIMLSKLNSTCDSFSSRSTTNLSIYDLQYENNSSALCLEKTRTPCRELFPQGKSSNLANEIKCNAQEYTEIEKAAALKITACVQGYLIRRLFKTEKVQQLIEFIKESLEHALSLQTEAKLKKNDLELYERLAQQTNSALHEFHAVMSSPVHEKMAIIAADRERKQRPISRPSCAAVTAATQKCLLRKQQNMNRTGKISEETRKRSQSLSHGGISDLTRRPSSANRDCSTRKNNNCKAWR